MSLVPKNGTKVHSGSSHFKTFKNRDIEKQRETKEKEKNERKKLININFKNFKSHLIKRRR